MTNSLTTVDELARLAARTVGERLAEQAKASAGEPLLTVPGLTYTYAAFDSAVNRRARGFADLGVGKGDTVCQMVPNGDDFLVNWMALAKLGAVEVGINTEFRGAALTRLLNSAQSHTLVLDPQFMPSISEIAGDLPHLRRIIYPATTGFVPDSALASFATHLLEEVTSDDDSPYHTAVTMADPLMLIFTSGTTGVSKAVEISHGYALHFASELIEHFGLVADDVVYSAYPLFHAEASILTFLVAVHCGARAVIMPKFSASRFWADVRSYGVTYTTLLGAVMSILWKQPEQPDDADNPLRIVTSCPTPDFWPEFERRFGVICRETYGATECCQPTWDVLGQPHHDGGCGKPCDHHEVRIVNDLDEPLPVGVTGEIVVRPRDPYTSMTGYYGNEQATAEAFRNLWFHTGDLGYLDEAGFLHFVGRMKDSIRRRGKNISAYEVEEVLDQHPAVRESAVIAVPSDLTEDEVKAVITLRPGAAADPAELVEWARSKLPRYSVPRYVEVTDELPKSPTGKVQKVQLRADWCNRQTFDADTASYLTGDEA
jgi:carnitine-CoA ligase